MADFISVTSITFLNADDTPADPMYVKQNVAKQFKVKVLPANATVQDVTFSTDASSGVTITPGQRSGNITPFTLLTSRTSPFNITATVVDGVRADAV